MAPPKEPEGTEVSAEDMKRYADLFKKLDVNNDGSIEVSELATALRLMKVSEKDAKGHAQEIMSKGDKDDNLEMDMAEFVHYMQNHEKQLKLAFSDLDKNKDGQIEPSEVQSAMSKLGISIGLKEAEDLTRRIDKDGDLKIDWAEWRDFFHMLPGESLEEMVAYWRASVMIDIGDSLTVPPEFTTKERKTGMWWRHLVAGGLAGAVSRTFTAPLDRVKVMLQVHGSTSNLTIASAFKQMLAEGGIKSLWRGNGTNILKIAPESALKFAAYEQFKRLIKGDREKEITIIERFAAGSTAGATAQSIIYPMEVIKTRLAVSKTGQYKGILDCGMKVYQKEGAKALYRGYLPNLLGIIPYAGIDLTIYETLKQKYIRDNPQNKDPGVFVLLACGTMSSTCGQLASYPLALVRTRLQASANPAEVEGGMVTMAKNIMLSEGPRGLYRGILPNFLKVLPAVSVSYVMYEKAKSMLGIHPK